MRNLSQYYNGKVERKLLFHSTSKNDPFDAIKDFTGMDKAFSKDGYLGKAIYFHENVSYTYQPHFRHTN